MSVQTVCEEFDCGMTRIYALVKNKEATLAIMSPMPQVLFKNIDYLNTFEINDKLYEWYLLTCSKNIYADGLQLKEKSKGDCPKAR